MRVLHTSDWHIGRRFKGIDLLEWHRKALEWLVGAIGSERVDVLCVAGDVYDSPRPSTEAVRLFNDIFAALGTMEVNGHPLEIVFTPGNHDSADRLGTGAALMRPNVHMRCDVETIGEPVIVTVGDEKLAVYALPYLDPDLSRPVLQGILDGQDDPLCAYGEQERDKENHVHVARSHEGVMKAAMQCVVNDLAKRRAEDPALAAILMAHAFVSGAHPSDSERNISVGGVDSVPAALFANSGLDYLALGHLHRPQNLPIAQPDRGESVFHESRTPKARYSGSLLAYSFSERRVPPAVGNGKSVVLLDLDAAHTVEPGGNAVSSLRTLDVRSGEPAFVQIDGTLDEVLGSLADEYGEDWVSVTIRLSEYPHGLYQRIDAKYAHALEKNPVYTGRSASAARTMADMHAATDEMDVLTGFVRYSLGREARDDERNVLAKAVEAVRSQGAEHARGTGMTERAASARDDAGALWKKVEER